METKIFGTTTLKKIQVNNTFGHFFNYNKFHIFNLIYFQDFIPWCHTCKYIQPNEPGVGCTYLQFNPVEHYYGVGDYPCGDLDVISIDPEEKWGCFLATPEIDIDENCAKPSLCLIKKENRPEDYIDDAALTTTISIILIFTLNFIL